jgi:hypothetical protein
MPPPAQSANRRIKPRREWLLEQPSPREVIAVVVGICGAAGFALILPSYFIVFN